MITKIGKEKLEQQIRNLELELRRTVEERAKAAAEGDLKENSAYIFLGERASVLSSQISQAKDDLKQSKVLSAPSQNQKITFGHKVTVHFNQDDRQMTITLVGKNDSHLKPDWISIDSPIGQALLGKKVSDQVSVNGQIVAVVKIDIGDI